MPAFTHATRPTSLGLSHAYYLTRFTCCIAASITRSFVNPNSFCRIFSGAEDPNVVIPMTAPVVPTSCAQPNVAPCSNATRAATASGTLRYRQPGYCGSIISHQRKTTTRPSHTLALTTLITTI